MEPQDFLTFSQLQRDSADLNRLWARLALDYQCYEESPHQFDALYMHGLSAGMVEAADLFQVAASRSRHYSIPIAFNGSDGRGAAQGSKPGGAWPGAEWYRTQLRAAGIGEARLFPTRPGLHSRDEADALVELAKEEGWKCVGIVTVPYHWPRSLSCIIGAMAKADYEFLVYMVTPFVVNVDEEMLGSQGAIATTYDDEAGAEVERIFRYWAEGRKNNGEAWQQTFGAPYPVMKAYLDRRDKDN